LIGSGYGQFGRTIPEFSGETDENHGNIRIIGILNENLIRDIFKTNQYI